MNDFHRYPELVTLDKRPEILAVREAIATEKLHGSNFRVYFPAGLQSASEVRFGSRNEIFADGDTSFFGGRPVRWFRDNPGLLERLLEVFASRGFSDVVVYGEVCGGSVQKGVKYTADGEIIFRAFDIRVGGNFVTYDLFVELCDEAQLPRVPEIWRGDPSKEAFDALLEQPSTEARKNGVSQPDHVSEGVVIRSNPLLRDVFGDWLIIKHKSAKYREATPPRTPRGPAEKKTSNTALDDFTSTFVVSGRVLNAIGRLRDAGAALTGTMTDMPSLAEAIVVDLHKECEPEWRSVEAAGFTDKQIRNAVTRALAGVYREMLSRGEV